MSNQYSMTAEDYRSAGQSVDESLAAPSSTTATDNGGEIVDNPLRYDFEAAISASGRLSPSGASTNAFSLAAFLLLPVLGFITGVILATHDIRSGSIRVRWPRAGAVALLGAKASLLCALMVMVLATVAVTSTVAGTLMSFRLPPLVQSGELPFITPGFTLDILATAALDLLVAAAFGCLGLAIASLLRERTFTITLFVLTYFLLPIVGVSDPRNFIPVAGQDVLNFGGSFQPVATGDAGPSLGITGLALICTVSLLIALTSWKLKPKVA